MKHILEENRVKFECAVSCIRIYKQQLGRYQVSHVNVGQGQTELGLTGRCVSGHRHWQNSHEEC